MTKSQRKAKTRSFEVSKACTTWSPKTWATARRNQAKHSQSSRSGRKRAQHHYQSSKQLKTARPSRRGKGSTHLAKATQVQLPLNRCNLSNVCTFNNILSLGVVTPPLSGLCETFSPLLIHALIKLKPKDCNSPSKYAENAQECRKCRSCRSISFKMEECSKGYRHVCKTKNLKAGKCSN